MYQAKLLYGATGEFEPFPEAGEFKIEYDGNLLSFDEFLDIQFHLNQIIQWMAIHLVNSIYNYKPPQEGFATYATNFQGSVLRKLFKSTKNYNEFIDALTNSAVVHLGI
jgi:hypothetical protein